ncbi:hypothetical protein F0562_026740 [Nyssa sinensis]|uniref:Uncharacterized protein n=1 Tax=Nyssa sinensis TaxID=561372 RepID=A0A5J5BBM1_9ASTE|nr:hypothetical protein F0562_026740 [Nyssa sinensis]
MSAAAHQFCSCTTNALFSLALTLTLLHYNRLFLSLSFSSPLCPSPVLNPNPARALFSEQSLCKSLERLIKMEAKSHQRRPSKRPSESENIDRPNKRPAESVNIYEEGDVQKIYKFRVLLPNGTSLELKFREPDNEMPIEQFIDTVKEEYFRTMRPTEPSKVKRRIDWKSQNLYFVDAFENMITNKVNFNKFKPEKYHIIRLQDGSREVDSYELPEEYTFETAMADLIDNSLQAIWSNSVNERRLIEDRISIFDTGPGMDGSEENSIVKWGKMGASLQRSSRGQAIGGKPPYLMPFFGMFGYGGPVASMHLGRHAMVSSKTKNSKKVYTLHLKREALLNNSGSEQTWRTDGGIRHPIEDEMQKSPQGTFTKVEIFEPKMKSLDVLQLQCKLKDIYFPYIQSDEVSNTRKTIMPIEFQVNGVDLAEIEGGEVAITNLHSSNGPEFVVQLHFHFNRDILEMNSPGLRASQEANARLKCIYFPIVEGKENIERILEKLEEEGCGITENFETFSRVSIRRLGRLLPDARWAWLPFMEPRQKKGDKAHILKRCCLRAKCFIETDAGFYPTPSKTDLAHHHPYTTALRNFGNKPSEKEKEVNVDFYKDGKPLSLLQLDRQYQEWIYQMHDRYDEEIDCGEDQPLIVVNPSDKKRLSISSDVVRVHKIIRRKGTTWKSGQKIKVLKGACTGCHKNNVYATLEYILLEGFQGDAGEARIICRPLGLPDENGCILAVNDGSVSIDIRGSISLPISVIDSVKCLAIETAEWNYQLEKQRQKTPSIIDILSANHCQELEVEGAFPIDAMVYAGHVFPKEIVAVVRPVSFHSASTSKNLDQKYIVREIFSMTLEIKFRTEDKGLQDVQHIYSGHMTPSSRKGFHGLYIFPLESKCPKNFEKAGVYTFSFSLRERNSGNFEKSVQVKALSEVGKWGHLCNEKISQYNVRVGSCFPPFSLACYDIYDNRIPFTSVPEVVVKISSGGRVLANVHKMKVDLSSNKFTLKIKEALIESNELDSIRPLYGATLVICPSNELFSVSIPCQVIPGSLQLVTALPPNLERQLLPGNVIKELFLEMFDAYGNHVEGGMEVLLNVDGFHFQDQRGSIRKVDDRGCIDLSSLLRVTGGYGKNGIHFLPDVFSYHGDLVQTFFLPSVKIEMILYCNQHF